MKTDWKRLLTYYRDQGVKADQPFMVAPVTTLPSQQNYDVVLAGAGGFPRDVVTDRAIMELEAGTGSWGRNDPGNLLQGLTAGTPPADADDDGVADAWESAHGLDPADGADHATVMASGYTAIEEYVNELADALVP